MAKGAPSKSDLRPSQDTVQLERNAVIPAPYVRHIPRRRSMRDQAAELAQRQAQAESRPVRPNTQDSDTTINKGEAQKLFEEKELGASFEWAWDNVIQGIVKTGSGFKVEESAVLSALATIEAYEAEKSAADTDGEESGDEK